MFILLVENPLNNAWKVVETNTEGWENPLPDVLCFETKQEARTFAQAHLEKGQQFEIYNLVEEGEVDG